LTRRRWFGMGQAESLPDSKSMIEFHVLHRALIERSPIMLAGRQSRPVQAPLARQRLRRFAASFPAALAQADMPLTAWANAVDQPPDDPGGTCAANQCGDSDPEMTVRGLTEAWHLYPPFFGPAPIYNAGGSVWPTIPAARIYRVRSAPQVPQPGRAG